MSLSETAPPRRAFRHLQPEDRHQIEALVKAGHTNPTIADILGVDPTTVRRERQRLRGPYDAVKANTRAKRARKASDGRPQHLNSRPGRELLELLVGLMTTDRRCVAQALTILAEQARQLPFPVTVTLVYRWIRRCWKTDGLARQANNAMIRPTSRWYRRQRASGRSTIANAVELADRPAAEETRTGLGVWEGDLVKGAGGRTTIATLVCRASRLTRILWVPSGQSDDVDTALRHWVATSGDVVSPITWDRGVEMCQHAAFTADTGVRVYFCPPRSPWLRGTNENTNGVLRRWWPKGTNLPHDPTEIARVEQLVNTRPMPSLSWKTPEQVYQTLVTTSTLNGHFRIHPTLRRGPHLASCSYRLV